jgi:hypothetical protein
MNRKAMAIASAAAAVAVAGAAAWFLWPTPANLSRSRVTEAINALGVVKTQVSEAFDKDGFPAPRTEKSSTPTLSRVEVLKEGRILGILSIPEVAELDGKRITYEPVVEKGHITGWVCASDAPERYLPAACRP